MQALCVSWMKLNCLKTKSGHKIWMNKNILMILLFSAFCMYMNWTSNSMHTKQSVWGKWTTTKNNLKHEIWIYQGFHLISAITFKLPVGTSRWKFTVTSVILNSKECGQPKPRRMMKISRLLRRMTTSFSSIHYWNNIRLP